jgi:hypothetical protein
MPFSARWVGVRQISQLTSIRASLDISRPAYGNVATSRAAEAVNRIAQSDFTELVRMRGLEPPRHYWHMNLNHARLPIPPHPQWVEQKPL